MSDVPATPSHRRDIIVIGASAGGLAPLQQLLAALPGGMAASIFIVLHIGAHSHLAQVLASASALPVVTPRSGEAVLPARVYVAPPDRHLLLHDHHILLRRGPRENLARPAIDPLFRSAAIAFGGRVVGVLLSGALNDGTAGLRAIKRCGGLTVVQHPVDAAVAQMPLSAMAHVDVDHVVAAEAMGPLLTRTVQLPAGPTPEIPGSIRLETAIAAEELPSMSAAREVGDPAPFTCPECSGALWEVADGSLLRYRCHVGHAYTADAMLAAQRRQADELLSRLLRTHRDRAVLSWRLAEEERGHNRVEMANWLVERARGYEEDAELIRRLLVRVDAADEPSHEAEQEQS